MNENEYGISLKFLTNQFRQQMQSISASVKSWAKNTEAESKVTADIEITDAYTKLKELEVTIKQLKNEMKDMKPETFTFREYAEALKDAESEAKQLKESLNGTNGVFSTKKVSRFLLSLFSIRSAFSLISRASHTYISQNDKLNSQIQTTTYLLGSTLAPVIQKVIDVAEYAGLVISNLIRIFTGYDAVAETMINANNKIASSGKKASKSLAGFDTIQNLADSSSSGASNIKGMADAFTDFQKKADEVRKIFDEYEPAIKIATGALLTFAGVNVMSKLATLIGTFGTAKIAGTGLAGISGLLTAIATPIAITISAVAVYGAYTKLKELKDGLEELEEKYGKLNKQTQNNISNEEKIKNLILDKIKLNKITDKEVANQITLIKDRIKLSNDSMKNLQDELDKMSVWEQLTTNNYKNYREQLSQNVEKNKTLVNSLYEIGKAYGFDNEKLSKIGTSTDDIILKMQNQIQNLNDLNKYYNENTEQYKENVNKINLLKGKLNDLATTTKERIEKLKEENSQLDTKSKKYQENKKKIDELESSLSKIDKNYNATVKITAEADTSKAQTAYDKLFEKIRLSNSLIGSKNFASELKKIWSYDVGTNYVPNDQLAMIHKGEMIVPSKYNPATSGIGGNQETNQLLSQLLTTLENKDFTAVISKDDVGKASVSYINDKTRQLGRSVIK